MIFKNRSFEEYLVYFGIDVVAEFVILIIVSNTLKYNGFFGQFGNLIN